MSEELLIEGEEGRHAFVLRIRSGESVGILNGKGQVMFGLVKEVTKHNLSIRIKECKTILAPEPLLHLAISPTKQLDRFEWFLEKAAEFGVSAVTPLVCDHTDRITYKYERWQKILVSALKQSGRPYLPVLNQATDWSAFLQLPHAIQPHLAHSSGHDLRQIDVANKRDLIICIGPEGDFSAPEIEQAEQLSIPLISLGNYRLRTETAGVMLAAYFSH